MSSRKFGLSKGQSAVIKALKTGRETGTKAFLTPEECYLAMRANWAQEWRKHTEKRMLDLERRGLVVPHPYGWALPEREADNENQNQNQISLF